MRLRKITTRIELSNETTGDYKEFVIVEFEQNGNIVELYRDIAELPPTDRRAWAESEIAAHLATTNYERVESIVYASEVEADSDYGGVRQWYKDHPNAELLFTLTVTQLDAEIDALDFSSMPAGTANKLKLLLKTLSMTARVLARREGLI